MGPLSSRCLCEVVGYRGYSVGFCQYGNNRVACRIVDLVWDILRIGAAVFNDIFLLY